MRPGVSAASRRGVCPGRGVEPRTGAGRWGQAGEGRAGGHPGRGCRPAAIIQKRTVDLLQRNFICFSGHDPASAVSDAEKVPRSSPRELTHLPDARTPPTQVPGPGLVSFLLWTGIPEPGSRAQQLPKQGVSSEAGLSAEGHRSAGQPDHWAAGWGWRRVGDEQGKQECA